MSEEGGLIPIVFEVTNEQPGIIKKAPKSIMELFQKDGKKLYPFVHQGKIFRVIGQENREVFLAAGTASGKTLAVSILLFWTFKMRQLRKILFMYPPIALLEGRLKMIGDIWRRCYRTSRSR